MELIDLRETIRQIKKLKKENKKNFKVIRIAFLRNYTVERVINYLELFLLQEGFLPKFYFSEYDNIFQDILNESSNYYKFKPDITILSLATPIIGERLTYNFSKIVGESLEKEINQITTQIEDIISTLSQKNVGTIFVHNFETPKFPAFGILDYQSNNYQINCFRKINLALVNICEKYKEVNIVDIDFLQRFFGTELVKDNRYWYIEKNPYSQKFLQLLAREYIKFIKALKGRVKKCLILDLDDTLWGGIIGEDGLNGIKIGNTYPGSAFKDFQRSILNLYNRGIILGICSRNNIEDVKDVFENHPDMVLRLKHFSIIKVNWNDKAGNIRNISEELNISLNNILYVDDNPFEINLVKTELPTVDVVQLPNDVTLYADIIEGLGAFDSLSFSEEDKKRTEMYQTESKRKDSKSKFSNLDNYLQSLEMKLKIFENDLFSAMRISQLCQKTNQFNLTTKRYTEKEIISYIEDNDIDVFAISLKDKFGDLGIIGAAIIKYLNNKAVIDSFLLSCRSLGRGVENAFLYHCLNAIKNRGCSLVNSYYYKTKKNNQVEDFFNNRGFQLLEKNKDGEKTFVFDRFKHTLAKSPKYFDILI